jgi:hypothetical protein
MSTEPTSEKLVGSLTDEEAQHLDESCAQIRLGKGIRENEMRSILAQDRAKREVSSGQS